MSKGKLIDENQLKEWLDCDSESFGELCGEQLFTRTELERLCRKLIDELSEEKEYCTCVNSISLNNGEKDICFDCRKDCNETSFAIKLANGINELHNTISKLETDNAALSKELTEIKLKLKENSDKHIVKFVREDFRYEKCKNRRIIKIGLRYYPQHKNWLGYWVNFVNEIPHYSGTTNVDRAFNSENEAYEWLINN